MRVEDPQVGSLRLDELTRRLVRDIRELGAASVRPVRDDDTPQGARGDATVLGALVALVSSPVLVELIRFLRDWVAGDRSVELTSAAGTIKIAAPTTREQEQLVAAWIDATNAASDGG
jgi:hypothetical protein